MIRCLVLVASILCTAISLFGQTGVDQNSTGADFKLALPDHPGQLQWRAEGFKVVETSAKSNRQEIGIRAQDDSKQVFFLGFLFVNKDDAPMTGAKCRDGVLGEDKKNPSLKVLSTSEISRSDSMPVAVVSYVTQGRDGKKWYSARAFLAKADICGDLEFYSEKSLSADDPGIRKTFESYRLATDYVPQWKDAFIYAQILYEHHLYKGAGPVFEEALKGLPADQSQRTMVRVITDQAGMSYGIAGDIPKAREIFEAAIAKDPDYPLYYYNLACADAEEKKLSDARAHLQEAFARKKNMISGETIPDPTKDDSFLPYKDNKEFWSFLQSLR